MSSIPHAKSTFKDLDGLAHFTAISKTRSVKETIQHLITQTLAILSADQFLDIDHLRSGVSSLFGITLTLHELEKAVEWLKSEGHLTYDSKQGFKLANKLAVDITNRIELARKLESDVRKDWMKEVDSSYPSLDCTKLWEALIAYLAASFRRHGVHTVKLLDSSFEAPPRYTDSLSKMLDSALARLDARCREDGRKAITEFLTHAPQHPKRSDFITQLADGAFNYFSVCVDPAVANTIRKTLKPTTLLLDTNFLLSVLELSNESLSSLTKELVAAIGQNSIPFHLRYHKVTLREMRSTISHYGEKLRSNTWSQAISRAAIRSRALSGIELRFHTLNIIGVTNVDDFMVSIEHPDTLLNDKGIKPFNSADYSAGQVAHLAEDYKKYLAKYGREKHDSQLTHDMTMLLEARTRRTRSRSTLEAGHLVLTCDFSLFSFDWDRAQDYDAEPCTVLPNQLWQIIRPMVPATSDFDAAFVETFAVPEFTTIGSGATEAASRLLGILGSLSDLTEDTATKLLANRTLLDKITPTVSEQDVADYIAIELAEINTQLLHDKRKLEKEVHITRSERDDLRIALDNRSVEIESLRTQMTQYQASNKHLDSRLHQYEEKHKEVTERLGELETNSARLQRAREEEKQIHDTERQALNEDHGKTKKELTEEVRKRAALESRLRWHHDVAASVLGVALAVPLGWGVYSWLFQSFDGFARSTFTGLVAIAVAMCVVTVLRPAWRGKLFKLDIIVGLLTIASVLFSFYYAPNARSSDVVTPKANDEVPATNTDNP